MAVGNDDLSNLGEYDDGVFKIEVRQHRPMGCAGVFYYKDRAIGNAGFRGYVISFIRNEDMPESGTFIHKTGFETDAEAINAMWESRHSLLGPRPAKRPTRQKSALTC
ncbi:hypothetical protein V5J36_000181 [Endozoicomonas sp. NE41]